MTGDARFDRVIVVDGSASSTARRGRDSIWVAVGGPGGVEPPSNPATRADAAALVVERCVGRTLLLVDWSLGYPVGTAALLGLDASGMTPRRSTAGALTALIVDGADNTNNRFAVAAELNRRTDEPGPFWGVPASTADEHLTATKRLAHSVDEWRIVEHRLRAMGHRPASCWQLLGAGSVGGQTLLGIPLVERLRSTLGPDRRLAVWPFDTGLEVPSPIHDVVVAETWPTLFPFAPGDHRVRDAAQVDAVARACLSAMRSDDLARWFVPEVDDVAAVVGEEGWILGAT